MIVVRLQGGLGNQMFQYALGKHLAIKNKTVLKLDVSLLHDHSSDKFIHRFFDLDIFDLEFHFVSEKEILYFNGKKGRTLIEKTQNFIKNNFLQKKLILENGRQFHPEILNKADDICLAGSWQSYKYFNDMRELLMKEFTVKAEVLNIDSYQYYKHMIEEAESSVSIHIRRGDYISNDTYNDLLGVLDVDYYKKAILKLPGLAKNIKLFVFSEDINWCKENLLFEYETVFVEHEKSKKSLAADLKLMSLCKYHIISNSTFAWWGAWLSKFNNNPVIAPYYWVNSKWMNNPKVHAMDILPEEWIKIK